MDPCGPKTNVAVTRAAAMTRLLMAPNNASNKSKAALCGALNRCSGTSLPLPPMTKTTIQGYDVYTAIDSPLTALQFTKLFRGEGLGPIASRLGISAKGVDKKLLKSYIVEKLRSMGVPEPLRIKAPLKKSVVQPMTDQLLHTNTNASDTGVANANANNRNGNRPRTLGDGEHINQGDELNFRPNGEAVLVNKNAPFANASRRTGAAKGLSFSPNRNRNTNRNVNIMGPKTMGLTFSPSGPKKNLNFPRFGAAGNNFKMPKINFGEPKNSFKMPKINLSEFNVKVPKNNSPKNNFKMPKINLSEFNVKAPKNNSPKEPKINLGEFKLPKNNAPNFNNGSRNNSETRAAPRNNAETRARINAELARVPRNNSEARQALELLKQISRVQPVAPTLVTAAVQAPNPVQYVQQQVAVAEPPKLVEARREAEQARSSAGASSPVTQQAEQKVREIERVVYRNRPKPGAIFEIFKRKPINWNKESLTNNQKMRLQSLRNQKIQIPDKVRSGRNLVKFYNEAVRTGKLSAIQKLMTEQFGSVVNVKRARANGDEKLKNLLNNVYGVEEAPAPNGAGEMAAPPPRGPQLFGMRAPALRRGPQPIVVRRNRVGWLGKLRPGRRTANNAANSPNGDARPGRVAKLVSWLKRQGPMKPIYIPKSYKNPLTYVGIENDSPVYKLIEKTSGRIDYYGKDAFEKIMSDTARDPLSSEPINMNRVTFGKAKIVNLEFFGNISNSSKLRNRLATLVPYMHEGHLKSKGGKVTNITNMKAFTASMNNNKHYEELMAFLTRGMPLSERVNNFFKRVGLRRGVVMDMPVNKRASMPVVSDPTLSGKLFSTLNMSTLKL